MLKKVMQYGHVYFVYLRRIGHGVKLSKLFWQTLKWSKVVDDSSDFDDFWTELILTTRSIVWDTLRFSQILFVSDGRRTIVGWPSDGRRRAHRPWYEHLMAIRQTSGGHSTTVQLRSAFVNDSDLDRRYFKTFVIFVFFELR